MTLKEDTLYRIQKTDILRVGFNADMKPFMYYNKNKELAGFDASYAYLLAESLHAKLEFIPFSWPNLVKDIQADRFDIAMSAIYVSESRLGKVSFSEPYFKSSIAIIAPFGQRGRYKNANQIQNIKGLRIGIFNDPILIDIIKSNFPNATIVLLPNFTDALPIAFAEKKIDFALWSKVQCDAFSISHPKYITLTPDDIAAPFLMAYMMNKSSSQFVHYVNYWLEINKNNGFYQRAYRHWILARPIERTSPRWSVWHNVLNGF